MSTSYLWFPKSMSSQMPLTSQECNTASHSRAWVHCKSKRALWCTHCSRDVYIVLNCEICVCVCKKHFRSYHVWTQNLLQSTYVEPKPIDADAIGQGPICCFKKLLRTRCAEIAELFQHNAFYRLGICTLINICVDGMTLSKSSKIQGRGKSGRGLTNV